MFAQTPYTFTSQPRLVPVVEFEPFTYAKQTHPYGEGTSKDDPEGWERYWRNSLADSGITGLDPFPPKSWLIPVERLTDQHVLKALVQAHADVLQDKEDPMAPQEWLESLDAFQGGFVLCDGETPLVPPGCCCCLGNLADWRAAEASAAPDWENLWIGHPQASISHEGDHVFLRQNREYGPPLEPTLLALPAVDLRAGIAAAEEILEAFAVRLETVAGEWLSSLGLAPEGATQLARTLAGAGADRC